CSSVHHKGASPAQWMRVFMVFFVAAVLSESADMRLKVSVDVQLKQCCAQGWPAQTPYTFPKAPIRYDRTLDLKRDEYSRRQENIEMLLIAVFAVNPERNEFKRDVKLAYKCTDGSAA
ncbi:hypothetical protein LTR17_027662, partial [Elasticomyces elasticus]